MSERMGIVESDERFDGTLNNGLVEDGDDECFGNLEFPTDFDGNLELPTDFELLNFELMENDGVIGDWNVCEWKIPEPSSLDDFMPMDENPDAKQLLNDVEENSGSHIYKIADNFQESSYVFHPTSPVSELESSGSCSAAKFLPIKSNITKPRSKRSRPTSSVNKWNLIVPFPAPAPRKTSNPRKNKKINKKTSHSSVSVTKDMQNGPVSTKKCTHCEITKTPQWREGPNGLKTLCNACGVRYRSGRLFPEYRPAASPTFVPQLHSNSHKKVVEMRNKAKCSSTKMEEPFLCPEVEFHPVSSYLLEF